jgi:hypothetical protein
LPLIFPRPKLVRPCQLSDDRGILAIVLRRYTVEYLCVVMGGLDPDSHHADPSIV